MSNHTYSLFLRGLKTFIAALTVACGLSACSTGTQYKPDPPFMVGPEIKGLTPAEKSRLPGYYTVRKNDSFFSIASDHEHSETNIRLWNRMQDVEWPTEGAVLRVAPPEGGRTVDPSKVAAAIARKDMETARTIGRGSDLRELEKSIPGYEEKSDSKEGLNSFIQSLAAAVGEARSAKQQSRAGAAGGSGTKVIPQSGAQQLASRPPTIQQYTPNISIGGVAANTTIPDSNNTSCPSSPTLRNKAHIIAYVSCRCSRDHKGETKITERGATCVNPKMGAAGYIFGCGMNGSGPPTCTSR